MTRLRKILPGTIFPKSLDSEFRPRHTGLRILHPAIYIPKLTAVSYEKKDAGLGRYKSPSSLIVQRGPHKGKAFFFLTLEERRTCGECPIIRECYGNNMPVAVRKDAFAPGFLGHLEEDVKALAWRYRGRGFLVRLHELGDFYDFEYVNFWERMLEKYPKLAIYGYSHRNGEIGKKLDEMFLRWKTRFAVMDSNAAMGSWVRPIANTTEKGGMLCRYQAGKVPSCSMCGTCMNGKTFVRFNIH